jgi:16S rRNA G966 N2-methylase RsmD
MRITGSRAKWIQPVMPEDAELFRPTRDCVREAAFSSIQGQPVNRFFLDVFGGIGNYGPEAASKDA